MQIRRIKALFIAQLKEFRRDFGAVFLSFVFPLFFVVILISTNLVNSAFTVEFALVDPHRQDTSLALADALGSENVHIVSMDAQAAHQALAKGKVKAVIEIPDAGLMGAQSEIELYADAKYAGYAELVLDAARARLLLSDAQAQSAYRYRVTTVNGTVDAQFSFIFPGMLALALLQLGLFSTATPILRARERGTLRYLLLTPLSVSELLLSQIGVRLCIALIQMVILLGAGMLVLDLDAAQWLSVVGVSLLGVLMLICIGYAIAGIVNSLDTGMAVVMILNFAMMFGGNIFWDPESSSALKIFAHLMPVSYLADLFRQLISGTEGLWPQWVNIGALFGWTALAIVVALRTFHFDMHPAAPKWQLPSREATF